MRESDQARNVYARTQVSQKKGKVGLSSAVVSPADDFQFRERVVLAVEEGLGVSLLPCPRF